MLLVQPTLSDFSSNAVGPELRVRSCLSLQGDENSNVDAMFELKKKFMRLFSMLLTVANPGE